LADFNNFWHATLRNNLTLCGHLSEIRHRKHSSKSKHRCHYAPCNSSLHRCYSSSV